jgi:ribosomal protein S27E
MPLQKIICEHCGSTQIFKDPELFQAVVQQIDEKSKEPIGPPTTFLIFKCLSCGEGIYLEKFKVPEETDFIIR